MKHKHLLIGAGMLALVLALITSSTVFAEGGTPPLEPEALPVEQEPLPEEPAVAGEAPVDEPPLEEEPPVEELSQEELVSEEQPIAADPPPAEEELPDVDLTGEPCLAEEAEALAESGLVLADADGVPLDLASQASAETLLAPDPYFKVGTMTYRFLSGIGACSAYPGDICQDGLANPIQAAINYIGNNGVVPADKKIYVESGTYTENVTIDGNNPTIGAGGLPYGTYLKLLTGLIGETITTQPIINGNITISNLIAGFTLNNFEVNGGITLMDNTGTVKVTNVKVKNTNGIGVNIYNQKGAVELNNVRSDGNKYDGAFLGAGGTGAYTVKITNSTFNDNATTGTYAGLWIQDFTGAITIDGISTNRNYGYGAYIMGSPASVTVKNSVFNDNTESSTSFGHGLRIELTGPKAVTLDNISAMRNAQNYGIYIATQGAVTVKNTRAEGNRNAGLYINNSGGGATAVSVTNGVFSNNTASGTRGLSISSFGTVTLTSVRAENNGGGGVSVNNCLDSLGPCTGSGGVTINSPAAGGEAAANVFSRNGQFGLQVLSRGAISLFNFFADENGNGSGVYLDNNYSNSTAAMTIGANLPNDAYGRVWHNSAYHNYSDGVLIYSNGAVSVSRVNANANQIFNIEINNNYVPDTAPKTVTLNSVNTNGYYGAAIYSQRGLNVETKGNVSITNITADQHLYDGVQINTCQYDGGLGKCLGSGSVTITSAGTPNSFSNNRYTGITVYARKAITLNNFTALSNGTAGSYNGVELRNDYDNCSGGISVNATLPQPFVNEVSGSTYYGIRARSKGAILLGRTLVKDNQNSYGAYLVNYTAGTDQPVTVRYSEFKNNNGTGLYVSSKGLITLTNVISENNTGFSYGVTLINTYGNGGVTVNTNGAFTNRFNNNYYDGLNIYSNGAVQISSTLAQGNKYNNIYIDNQSAAVTSPKAVTLTNVSLNGLDTLLGTRTSSSGLYIHSRGVVSMTGVTATQHLNDGITVFLDPPQSTVMLKNSISSRNGGSGIIVYGRGSVTLNNTSADDNEGGNGVFIDNCRHDGSYCTGTGGVSITAPSGKYASLSRNNGTGLNIYTGGAVTLTNIKAEENAGHGVSVYQNYNKLIGGVDVAVSGNVTVSGAGVPSIFSKNEDRGLFIQSRGNVSVTNAEIRHNHSYGLVVTNASATAAPTVSLTDINANYNWNGTGISIESKGAVTLKGIDASDNNVLVGEIWDGRKVVDHLSHTAGDDQWWFTTTGAYSVKAALNSVFFDAYLCLYNADGGLIICDNNSGGGTNALINSFPLTTPGDYYLSVRGANGKAGGYDLTLGSLSNTDYFYATGLYVDNSYSTTNTPVTITPSGRGYGVKANDNTQTGVYILSDGLVSITKGWSGFNSYNGFDIKNTNSGTEAGITLNSVYADDNFESGGARGFYLVSKGPVSWKTGSASRNAYGGADIDNSASTKFAAVTISGTTTSDNNGWHGGLFIESTGVVNLTSLISNGNGFIGNGSGLYVDNCLDSGGTCVKNVNVTLSGNVNQFNENNADGITIFSGGLVTLSNFTAYENTYSGVNIYNHFSGALGVTIKRSTTGVNEIMGNGQYGLIIQSQGAVLVEKVKAVDSGYSNIYIDNSTSSLPKAVTVKTTWVENSQNSSDGLYIFTYGAVLLDGVKAKANDYNGVRIDNSSAAVPAAVTVLRSVFEYNGARGLDINASGNITLGGIVARFNYWDGVRATSALGKATVSSSYGDNVLSYNGTSGPGGGSGLNLWNIYSTINVARVTAWDNSASGISLDNITGTNPGGAVTVSNVNLAHNLYWGSYIEVLGSLSVSSATVLDNGRAGDYDGIYISGDGITAPSVTISSSRIMGNSEFGINCWFVDTVTLTNVVNIGNDTNGTVSGEDNFYKWP